MISVIIPTHNRSDLLFYELEQIFKQKDIEFEVIVVNDVESKDPTDAIKTLFPTVHYIKSSKIQGPSEKHKAGLRIAKGEFLYLPDDDDFLVDEYFFKKAVDLLESDSALAFVSGGVNMRYENSDGTIKKIVRQNMNVCGRIDGASYLQEFQGVLTKPASCVSTIFKKCAFDEMNAIDMKECSDSSMYMLALFWGDAFILEDVVAEYRIRERGSSLTTTLSIPFIMNVLGQKEAFYYLSKSRLSNPKRFWYNQIRCTYGILTGSNNKFWDKFRVFKWCVAHFHGSFPLLVYLFAQLAKIVNKEVKTCGK